MKRLLTVFFCFSITMLVGCMPVEKDGSEVLLSVMNQECTFVTQNGKEVLLKDYMVGEGEYITNKYAQPYEYTYVDFDEDGMDEMVINISNDLGFYLVLHYEAEKVYGYEFVIRSLQSLKSDGSFIRSGGAMSTYYSCMTFDKQKVKITNTAIKDDNNQIYELYGKQSSIEELDKYIANWNQKENVTWMKCK